MFETLQRFFTDGTGADLIEYVLAIAAVLVMVFALLLSFDVSMDGALATIGNYSSSSKS